MALIKPNNDTNRNEQIAKLSREFCKILNSWLTPDQLKEINQLNKTVEYSDGSCATHNFCDPNQAMIDAYSIVFKKEIELDSDLINPAWNLARANEFKSVY